MTIFRQLAVRTLRAVIWLSSPDTRDWVKAMQAELDSIRSDWRAFLWAAGSVRILFVRQTIRPQSLSDIPAAAKVLTARMNHRTRVGSVVVAGMGLFFGWFSLHAPNAVQQTGCVVLVIAMLYLLFQLVTGRPRQVPSHAELAAQCALFRAELERERNFHRGRSLWSRLAVMIPGPVLVSVGGMIADPSSRHSQAIFLLLFFFFSLLAIPNNLRFARRYAHQMQELDDLELRG